MSHNAARVVRLSRSGVLVTSRKNAERKGFSKIVVPIGYGERLYARIAAPKKFMRFREGHHGDLDSHGAPAAVRDFLAGRLG